MITDGQAENANDWIRDHAEKYAEAKAQRRYLEEFRKSKKAELMNHIDGPQHERESYAYSHDEYTGLLVGYRIALKEEEYLNWMLTAAETKIDMWRTQQANTRKGI